MGELPNATRFKGQVLVTSIVDVRGRQERRAGDVVLAAGEELRVEVAVDRAGPIFVAYVGDDGTFLPLLRAAWLDTGTHLSEDALVFDTRGGAGVVVAGSPADVNRAKDSGDFAQVRSFRVRSEGRAGR
jgi:hypothetical protein